MVRGAVTVADQTTQTTANKFYTYRSVFRERVNKNVDNSLKAQKIFIDLPTKYSHS